MAQQQFLYTLKPIRPELLTRGPTEEEERIVRSHFRYLKMLRDLDILLVAGRTQNTDRSSFGIVVFYAEDELEARKIMEQDPGIAQGVFEAKLFPYHVALWGNYQDDN